MILETGQKNKYHDLLKYLVENGYERSEQINKTGQYFNVGGSFFVFPVNCKNAYKIDYFGDEIESIKPDKDHSKMHVEKIEIQNNLITLGDNTILKPGDYVVHIDHGIGIFITKGIKTIEEKEVSYIYIEYLNRDYLYLPENLVEKITKYIGVGKKPKLNKLGSQSWQKTKRRAYRNALVLAKDLLLVYAKREISSRQGYLIDMEWDAEAKKTFGYSETPDQENAIKDVYNDLIKSKPMDRLISGDVGYGKTEVALRAVVQAVANHKQTIIVCPTTILCQQHYVNIISRLSDMPINVSMLSRFVNGSKQKEVIRDLENGRIDVVIGTHKLLSAKIIYKNLDLVIIDEEQKFGVKQKEYFKMIRANINILSLSATPIPRTLFMSLSGIRDISQIISPPKGRKSIDTRVIKHNDGEIKTYIEKEVARGGQVFYLYNRVETIEAEKQKLQHLLTNVRFTVAHGQLPENQLEITMKDFADKKYDVLICSTIIENGLDLPNVNTLVVDNAENFGLSQLYQIRGRIGRSQRQAFALLMHKESELIGNVYRRLKSLVDNTELGSGFNVALSDLEIRGGGNIMGREQHGNMEAVGLALYSQMLKGAVDNLKKENI